MLRRDRPEGASVEPQRADLIMIEEDHPTLISYSSWHDQLGAAGFEQSDLMQSTLRQIRQYRASKKADG